MILLRAWWSIQKSSDPSGFFANSTGAPNGDKDSRIALASNNFSNYFLISKYFLGLYWYIVFCIGSVPSMRGISCTSPTFQLGGAHMGSIPGNTSLYIHNVECN